MATAVPAAITYTPSNLTQGQMIRDALNFVSAPSDSEVQQVALSGINAGISLINSRDWKKIIGVWRITLTQDQGYEEVESTYKAPISMLRLNSSDKRDGRVSFLPLQTFFTRYTCATVSGDIDCYTFDEKQRRVVWSAPVGSAYKTTYPKHDHYHHRRVAKLTSDSATTGLPPEFDDWLVMRGAMRLARVRAPDKLRYLRDEEREMWQWLRTSDNATTTDF